MPTITTKDGTDIASLQTQTLNVRFAGGNRIKAARQSSTLPMSGDGKRGVAEWPKLPRPSSTLPV